MDLLSFFRRRTHAAAPADRADGAADETEVRSRARRRLIGAVVLLGVGVIAFPLLFETEPRPIPVDLPIEIPRKEGLAPLAVPASSAARAASARITDTPAVAAAPPVAPPAAQQTPAPAPAPTRPPEPDRQPAAEAPAVEDGTRAKALLDAGAAAPPSAARYVVQIGAFAEDRAVRDVRAKVEKLGLVTYTQVIQVPAGERTRVRVGPFPRREEADATAAKLKKAGLPASVLTL